MPHGGQIELRTAAVTIGADESSALDVAPGAFLELAVRDTGTVDDGTKARIFEPFFTTKPAGEGTGLGLAMVYGIVRRAAARWQWTAPGQGLHLRVLLPRFDAALAAEVPSTSSDRASATHHVRVLLVEDEAMVRTLVARMLEEAGCIVTAHASGDDALA
ncbi:MAG: hypothetical protein U0163_15950 [Gemmatimonadaceae bacterium]